MLQQPAPRDAELRLALGMRGGVSLAVWIGGACAEIDELRRAAAEEGGFWSEVLECSPYKRVTVDVMAGASAGGLNGVLFAAAIRHGFRMDRLLRIWQEVADVGRLRRKEGPWSSLFDGDGRFLDVVRDELAALVDGDGLDGDRKEAQQEIAARQAHEGYVDLQLSATLLEAVEQAATSPGDEKLRRSRSTARFHFRHDPAAVPPRLDVERADLPRLAVAARGTASFPVAFDAAMVRSSRPATFQPRQQALPPVEPADDETAASLRDRLRLVECRGRFSESRGSARDVAELAEDDFLVADGGAVDNIPLAKALDAARDAPADGPTRRVLVYLHPTGPTGIGRASQTAAPRADDRRSPVRRNLLSVAKGLFASQIQSESIDGDLELLEAHNRTVRLGRVVRLGVLADLVREGSNPRPPSELAEERLGSYLNQRAVADAEEVRRLLADPLVVLGEDPFPVPPPEVVADGGRPRHAVPDDRWRSPLAAWSVEQRLRLDTSLRAAFTERLGQRSLGIDVLVGGIGPVQRSIDLLLELAREGEKQPGAEGFDLGAQKPALYRLGSFVREVARVRRLAWVCCADRLEPDGDVQAWVNWTLDQLRLLVRFEQALPAGLDDPTSAQFRGAAEAFLARCAGDLQTLAEGGELPAARQAGPDLRNALVARLQELADPILLGLPAAPSEGLADAAEVERRSGAEVIQRVLADTAAPTWEVRLASLEVLLVDEHLVGAPGRGEIGFARMSAAAPIIHAARFARLHEHSVAIDAEFTSDGHHLVPNVKLAGNELASFSAFLDEKWRINDWTWGRLDATASLVDLLLGEDRDDKLEVQQELDVAALREVAGEDAIAAAREGGGADDELSVVRRALIARRQGELLAIAKRRGLPEDLAKWEAGLETHVQPGSPRISHEVVELSSVAAHVVGDILPRRVPRVIGPLQGLLKKLAQQFARPRGGLPPAPGSAEALAAEAEKPEPKRRYLGLSTASVLVGVVLAGLAYAAADQAVSLAIGLAVGVFVGLVPGAILLWLAVQPLKPDQVGRRYRTAASVGVLLGAGLAAIVFAVGRAVF